MKYFNLILLFVIPLFISCSSTYRVTDFPSKEKFYDDFNKSGIDKSLKVVLINDSTIKTDNGAEILNDSLFIITMRVLTEEEILSKNDIGDIQYSPHNMSNTILLKNGKSVIAKGIKILPDSSIVVFNFKNVYKPLPLNKIKVISYKNHWLGVPVGLILGAAAGAGFGTFLSFMTGDIAVQRNEKNQYLGFALGSAIGFVTGGIIGWISGYTYIYEFSGEGGSASGGNP